MEIEIRIIVIDKLDRKWLQVHFCSYLQRAASILSCSPCSDDMLLSDSADLWFPVSKSDGLKEAVQFILDTHNLKGEIIRFEKVNEIRPNDLAVSSDWLIVLKMPG